LVCFFLSFAQNRLGLRAGILDDLFGFGSTAADALISEPLN
jgi:hypothetical protein